MTEEHNNEESQQSFWDKIKESPRTVSALIIILIVASAIYAFSGDTTTLPEEPTDDTTVASEEDTTNESEDNEVTLAAEDSEENTTEEDSTEGNQAGAQPTPVSQEQLAQQTEGMPEGTRNDQAFVESAQAGEGYTHMARRATTRWLSENNADYEITNEHRIYIEDYIQNRLGAQPLSVGQDVSISFELVQEAVNSAGQLSDQQLQNLTQYSPALT